MAQMVAATSGSGKRRFGVFVEIGGLMGGIVKLRLGDLFDGPSDLIVLPCSTIGTVTGFIRAPTER